MTKQTAVALGLTGVIWMGALVASAVSGVGSQADASTVELRTAAIHPAASPAELNACASGACW